VELGLAEKTVVITGGSGGIGRGLVLEFAREGAFVVSASRDEETGQKLAIEARRLGYPGAILAVATDVTKRDSVDAMVAIAHDEFGPIDVLVNNAGGVAHIAEFEEFDQAGRNWEIALNIDGVVNCTQAVAKDMLSRGKGSIVNISSNASLLGEAASNTVHYGGVKGFVNSFSKALAYEWGPKGVRVNNICPGWIVPHTSDDVGSGSFWKRLGPEQVGRPEDMPAALEGGELFNMKAIPISRVGRPEDIAHLALFLASDVAGYLTGQLISCSGGVYMH